MIFSIFNRSGAKLSVGWTLTVTDERTVKNLGTHYVSGHPMRSWSCQLKTSHTQVGKVRESKPYVDE